MRVPSGVTTAEVYFVALDATDLKTRETGLASFTVYRSRNGGAASAMTTPTVTEIDATNMPGVYALILDEDTTIDAGDDSQEMALHITHAGMAPVTRTIELYRPKITAGRTMGINGSGHVDRVVLVDTTTTNTDMRGTDSAYTGTPPTVVQIRTEIDSNSTQLAAIVADTNELQGDWANGGRLDLIIDAILADTGTDGVVVSSFTTAAKAEIEAEAEDALQLAIPDSVPADGSIPSVQQGIYMIAQRLTDFVISGTSLTVRKVDGSTTLFTLTLDSSTAPTSSTRSG